jgi:hypothetical protein
MKMAVIDTPELETAFLTFANDQYSRFLPGWMYFDGTLGNGRCRCISNEKTGKSDNYIKQQCNEGDGNYAMCEFKFPRGKARKCELKILVLHLRYKKISENLIFFSKLYREFGSLGPQKPYKTPKISLL